MRQNGRRRADGDAVNVDLLQEWTTQLSAVESNSVRGPRRPGPPASTGEATGDVLAELQALRQFVDRLSRRLEILEARQRTDAQPIGLEAMTRLRRRS
jgi:hypothetical protein